MRRWQSKSSESAASIAYDIDRAGAAIRLRLLYMAQTGECGAFGCVHCIWHRKGERRIRLRLLHMAQTERVRRIRLRLLHTALAERARRIRLLVMQ